MGAHRETPPLPIRPGFSHRLALFVSLTHALAALAMLGLPGHWRLLLIPVVASLVYQFAVSVLRLAPWSIRSLVWMADGTWHLILVSGTELDARLSPSTFVSVPLVVLNLRRGLWRYRSVPLFSDALDPEQSRRLRQRLRIAGVGAESDSALA
jgi:toxin CptA